MKNELMNNLSNQRKLTLHPSSPQVYDPYADAFTNGGWQVAIDSIPRSSRTPSVQQLAAGRLAELSNDYITQIQNDW